MSVPWSQPYSDHINIHPTGIGPAPTPQYVYSDEQRFDAIHNYPANAQPAPIPQYPYPNEPRFDNVNNYPGNVQFAPTPQYTNIKEPRFEARGLPDQASTPKPDEASQDSLPLIPITDLKPTRIMPIILIGLNFATTIILLVFIFHPIYLSQRLDIGPRRFATMILCVSALTVVLGAFTTSHTRRLYIQRFVHLHRNGQLKPRDREQCATSIGTAKIMEEFRSWNVGLSYAAAACITAAAVSCITPTLSTGKLFLSTSYVVTSLTRSSRLCPFGSGISKPRQRLLLFHRNESLRVVSMVVAASRRIYGGQHNCW